MKNILLAIIFCSNVLAVDYGSEIQPILESSCTSYCHTNGGAYTGGLDLTSYSNVMDGGNHGPVVIPGDSQNSNLVLKLGESPPFGSQMPEGGPYLSSEIILLISTWIDEGALEFEEPSCGDGFTYYSDLPQTVTIINGDNCLSDSDMSVLEDIVSLNNLGVESINLGTQNWANGRLVWLKIGDSFDGGNVNLTELPPSIGNLSNLGMLFLDYNSLTSLPESIGNLSNLIYLVLSFNDIVALPESIGNLSYLLWIDLGYNQVSYIPESIENLSNLQYLWLFNNQLESLPESICNLDLDWSGFDPADLPYFGCGGNVLCDANTIPECVLNSDNFEISLEANYYSFPIYVPQDCSNDCPSELGDTNGDGIINILDIVLTVNTVVFGDSSAIECAADINGDGIINILDIVQLVNIIVG